MKQQIYLDILNKCQNINETSIIEKLANNDFELSIQELDQIRDECVERSIVFFKQTAIKTELGYIKHLLKTMEVTNCLNCPFSSFSLVGHPKKRIQHSCNLQRLGGQFRADQKYTCFETCPLKTQTITVNLQTN